MLYSNPVTILASVPEVLTTTWLELQFVAVHKIVLVNTYTASHNSCCNVAVLFYQHIDGTWPAHFGDCQLCYPMSNSAHNNSIVITKHFRCMLNLIGPISCMLRDSITACCLICLSVTSTILNCICLHL